MSETALILLRDRPCLELVINSSAFLGFALVAEQTTGISLQALTSSTKVLKIDGPALSRLN